MASLASDLANGMRAARRSLARQPLVAVTVVLILALGVGATTAAFSVVRGVLVHSVPYPRAAELVQVTSTLAEQGLSRVLVAFPRFEAYAAQSRSFSALVAYAKQDFTLTEDATPTTVTGARVSPGFFAAIEVAPIRGREFGADEQARGGPRAAMIGERLWNSRFGGAADIVGRTIAVNGEAVPIVGVVPARIASPLHDADLWLPRVYESDLVPPEQIERGAGYLRVMGRLKPGATAATADDDLGQVVADYRQRFGANRDAAFDVAVVPLATYLFGDVRGTLVLLWVAGALVFLIACANAGNVLLARYLARRTELDIRTAMGATRSVLLFQLLSESALLALAGVVAGLAAALVLLQGLAPLASQVLSTGTPYAFDPAVFAVAAILATLSVVITGSVPALYATSEHRSELIASGSRPATSGRSATRWRRAFATAQIAVSYALLAGALQQATSLLALQRLDRGFDPRGLLAFQIGPSAAKYPTPESRLELYRQVEGRIGRIPGVSAVGASQAMPIGDDQSIAYIREADQARQRDEWSHAQFRIVSPGYLGALGATLIGGRGFSDFDTRDGVPVTVVNRTLARQHFGDANPVGMRIFLGSFPGAREVVGVVTDVPQRWLEHDPLPEAWIPGPQLPVRLPAMYFLVRSDVPPATLVAAIRAEVAAVDPSQAVTRVRTMTAAAEEGLAIPRLRAFLIVAFALVGGLLAAVGLWSVMSQFVSERARAMAIRLALGAPPGTAKTDVVRAVASVTAAGIAIGLAGALALGRLGQHLFGGIESPGVMALIVAAVLLSATSGITVLVLAGRAARVDPARVMAAS